MAKSRSRKSTPSKNKTRKTKTRNITPGRIRRIVPGKVWLITKKCTDDLFLIRPDEKTNEVLLYCLILAAKKRGIRIHAFCFQSNHFHALVTDVEGRLPAFLRDFLSDSSKALQVITKQDRRIWASRRYSGVECLDLETAERKGVYIEANPIRARLTDPTDWPGLTSARYTVGDTITATRPKGYFSQNSKRRPETVSMTLEPVARSFRSPIEPSQKRMAELLAEECATIHDELRRTGRRLAGADRVLAERRSKRGNRKVRRRNPKFAGGCMQRLLAAIVEEKTFQERHATAVERYLAGTRLTRFPHGTYGYRELLGVRVNSGGPAA